MKFWEAMKAFEEGKNVRCKDWLPGHFMCKNNHHTSIQDQQDFWFSKDKEWELYEESKKFYTFSQRERELLHHFNVLKMKQLEKIANENEKTT